MKILYLEHPQEDLNAYNIYKGLCEVVGEENVIDFPYKKIYRAEQDLFNSEYLNRLRREVTNSSLPYGIPPFQQNEDIISGWPNVTANYGSFLPASDHPQMGPQGAGKQPGHYPLIGLRTRGRDLSEDDIFQMLKRNEFAFIVLSSSHRVPTIALARFRDMMGGLNKLPPIIYTDNGERDELNEHWAHVFNPAVIFKCTLTQQVRDSLHKKYGWNLYSLPNSNFLLNEKVDFNIHFYVDEYKYDWTSKKYDVFYQFMGRENREDVIKTMEHYCKNNTRTAYPESADYHFYLELMANTKIVITHRGTCRETLRYWDIPLFPTLMLCDDTMGCIHPNPFEDKKNAIFYNDNPDTLLEELTDKCEYYLNNDSERERIALSGMQHLRRFHSNKARAQYMLEVIKQNGIQMP